MTEIPAEDRRDMDRIVEGLERVSDRIRALDRAGYARADIARYLGKRYQHVRNVLVEDRARNAGKKTDKEESGKGAPDELPRSVAVTIGPGGRIVIPAAYRDALGLKEGQQVVLSKEDQSLRLRSRGEALRRVQEIVSSYLPPGADLVEDLIAERRREGEREDQAGGEVRS